MRIQHLADQRLAALHRGVLGLFPSPHGHGKMKQHWRYLIARWGAYPVVWCLAGEGTMPYYLSKTTKAGCRHAKARAGRKLARYVRSIDPHHHPITIHPWPALAAWWKIHRCSISICCRPATTTARAFPTHENMITGCLAQTPRMPVLAGEVCYEGIMEASRQEIQRFMFWTCILSGAAGTPTAPTASGR